MKQSILTKSQHKTIPHFIKDTEYGPIDVFIKLRYDDECNNGHNTFAITCDIYESGKPRTNRSLVMCGCCHDFIAEYLPEYADLIKWHLCSSDGPMHYIANTLYHASDVKESDLDHPAQSYRIHSPDLEAARSTAIWPDATLEQLQDESLLKERLPDLLSKFAETMTLIGFTY